MLAGLAVVGLLLGAAGAGGAGFLLFAGEDATSVRRAVAEREAGGDEGEGEEYFHVDVVLVSGSRPGGRMSRA